MGETFRAVFLNLRQCTWCPRRSAVITDVRRECQSCMWRTNHNFFLWKEIAEAFFQMYQFSVLRNKQLPSCSSIRSIIMVCCPKQVALCKCRKCSKFLRLVVAVMYISKSFRTECVAYRIHHNTSTCAHYQIMV